MCKYFRLILKNLPTRHYYAQSPLNTPQHTCDPRS